jgi:predicted GNAT family N-acyltransferase
VSDRIISLLLGDILPLRVEVLRNGTPIAHCSYPEDSYDDAVHLGIVRGNQVVATSTWFNKPCPLHNDVSAVQLKGMAVSERLHGEGLGEQLIAAGVALATDRGATLVWARARDSALGFYIKCSFVAVGEGFVDEPTGMPHHIVVRHL